MFDERHEQYYQSDRWKQQRRKRLVADGFKCLLCGSRENLHVHHKYGIDYDEVHQLRTLCKRCHELVHIDPSKAAELEVIVKKKREEKYELARRREREWYASFSDSDLVNGGKYNLCKIEDIRRLFGEYAPIQEIRDVYSEIRWLECFKYFLSGYSQEKVSSIIGISKTAVKTAYKHYAGLKNYPIYESEEFYMKRIDMTNVQEAGGSKRLPAGAYICKISDVEDVPAKEYLKVTYDIAEGEFAGHYGRLREDHPDWAWVGAYVKSYKTKALPMFKRFCSAISKSNGSFVFDGNTVNADERTLIGKRVGLLFQEEEYYSDSGEKRTRLIVNREFPIDKIASQKVPAPKLLPEDPRGAEEFVAVAPGAAEEIPF